MQGTYTFNVCGAPGMGFGGGNVATADARATLSAPSNPSKLSDGQNEMKRTAPRECAEIQLFGRTF
jgi:hypothetical protein